MRSIAVVITCLLFAGAAWSTPTVYLEPAATVAEQGQVFTVSVRVNADADTLTCFMVRFTFDPSVVELLSAEEGTLFAESPHTTVFDWDTIQPGLHSCNDVTLGFDAFVLCPGELVHLEFYAAAEGSTPFSFTMVDLRDLRRDPILPVLSEGGTFTIGPGTGIGDSEQDIGAPALHCYPNPFSEELAFDYLAGDQAGPVSVAVHDVSGRVVARPEIAAAGPGFWDGRGPRGNLLPSGVYFVVAHGAAGCAASRVTLVR
ncbi:MAG TPA: cohesin domain-containing protein [bacterium]|nr:cohesin domain-containing protein [bacterium]